MTELTVECLYIYLPARFLVGGHFVLVLIVLATTGIEHAEK